MKGVNIKYKSFSNDLLELGDPRFKLSDPLKIDREWVYHLIVEFAARNRNPTGTSIEYAELTVDDYVWKTRFDPPKTIPAHQSGWIEFSTYLGSKSQLNNKVMEIRKGTVVIYHTYGSRSFKVRIPQSSKIEFYRKYIGGEGEKRAPTVQEEIMFTLYKYHDQLNITQLFDIIRFDYPKLSFSSFKRKYLYPLFKDELVRSRAGRRPGRRGKILFLSDDKGRRWVENYQPYPETIQDFLKRLPELIIKIK